MFTLLDGHKPSNRASEPIRSTVVSSSWQWANVPLPEPHLAAILAGGVLHLVRPWRLPGRRWWYAPAGWSLVGAGVAISASAVRTAAAVDLERPTTTPYRRALRPQPQPDVFRMDPALSWNRPCRAERLDDCGAPARLGADPSGRLREEQALEHVFGPAYVRYRRQVRRYL